MTNKNDVDVGYKNLAMDIVICAVRDWSFATRAMMNCKKPKLKDINKKEDAEQFFRSWWCDALCGIEGEIILSMLKREKNLTDIIARTRQMHIVNLNHEATRRDDLTK